MVIEPVPKAPLHEKGYGCLRPARKSSSDKHVPDTGKNYKGLQSTQQRGLGELTFLYPEENCQQPPDSPVHF